MIIYFIILGIPVFKMIKSIGFNVSSVHTAFYLNKYIYGTLFDLCTISIRSYHENLLFAFIHVIIVFTVILVAVVPENARIPITCRTYQYHGEQEDKTADGARFAFDEKAEEVQHHKHNMIVEECWINWFWN